MQILFDIQFQYTSYLIDLMHVLPCIEFYSYVKIVFSAVRFTIPFGLILFGMILDSYFNTLQNLI